MILLVLLLNMAAIEMVQMLIEAAEYLDRRERGMISYGALLLLSFWRWRKHYLRQDSYAFAWSVFLRYRLTICGMLFTYFWLCLLRIYPLESVASVSGQRITSDGCPGIAEYTAFQVTGFIMKNNVRGFNVCGFAAMKN